jgi:tetratricopeptide (TPR) repeat protein
MNLIEISKQHKRLLIFIAVIITFLCYKNHFNNPFEFDDEHTITTNLNIRSLKNIPNFFKDATTTSSLPANQAYRPGLTTLNTIDYAIGGEEIPNPFYFHVSIFISFILLGLCFLVFCKTILENYFDKNHAFVFSLIATLWLWVHTANSATINYIIQRADSFSTFMVMVAFWMYVSFPKFKKYYLYLIPVMFGFFVKEPVVMFAPLLLVYKLLFEQNQNFDTSLDKNKFIKVLKESIIPFALMIFLFLFSRYMTPKTWTPGTTDRWGYLFSQPYSILHYFNNFILPANLVIDTDWKNVSSFTDDKVIIGVGFLTTLLFIIYKTSKNHKPIAFGLIWFILALLPSSSIFPLAEVVNDHRPFFAYIGLFIVFAYCVGFIYNKYTQYRTVLFTFLSLLIATHGAGTFFQNKIWQTSEGVWHDATIKAPLNPRAWMNYGNTLLALGKFQDAEKTYTHAVKLAPTYSHLQINLGIVNELLNKKEIAESFFKKALELDKGNPDGYSFYARFLMRNKKIREARVLINNGLKISPHHSGLNVAKRELDVLEKNPNAYEDKKIETAIHKVNKHPSADNYLDLSLEYYNAKKYQDCIKACEEALKINPHYALAYNNICSAYNELKQWENAIVAGTKGLAIDPNNQLLKGNLNVALEELKKQK